jgi:hypothetical protein
LNKIHDEGPEYHFLIGRAEPEPDSLYHDLSRDFSKDPRFTQIASAQFTCKNQRGPEPWVLYKRIAPNTP